MQFAQTRKQKKQKEIPSHRMTGTRGSHFDRKKEAASLQRSTSKCRNRHWRVEGFGVYSAPACKAIIDGTVESIPPTLYNVLYHKSHFFARFFSKSGSFCTRLRFGSYAISEEMQFLSVFSVTQFPKVSVFPTFWEWDGPNPSTHLQFALCLSCMEKAPAMWYN